ncbi:MAG: hypothetical protein P4L16_02955 [Chlamydiales bacterium]|nr:hypothetical protein [Chlamydiales bacterium]
MLKLERTHTSQIKIVLQNKTPFLSLPLFKALLAAFGIHLLFIIFFNIETPSSSEKLLLPPVHVEADGNLLLKSLNSSPKTIVGPQGLLFKGAEQQLPIIRPKINPQSFSEPEFSFTPFEISHINTPSFEQIERSLYSDFEFSEEQKNPVYTAIRIHLSKDFLHYPIKKSCKKEIQELLKNIDFKIDNSEIFTVHLETNTGKLFGFTKNKSLEPFEKILKTLRFEKTKEKYIVDGQIEILLMKEETPELNLHITYK